MRSGQVDYSYAKLSAVDLSICRIGGAGLGNLLFPWARFVVGTLKYELKPLSPTWPQIKVGPLLRHESDKRFYTDVFVPTPEHIAGIRKLFLISTLPRISEVEFISTRRDDAFRIKHKPRLVEFANRNSHFTGIVQDHAIVKEHLMRSIKEKHKKGLQYDFGQSISVHVRLGDFRVKSLQTPLQWFVDAIKRVRTTMGEGIPVYIFSDGFDQELQPLLVLPGVRRITFGSSMADILALSRANILIANGGSSFSKWASYLGRMPVIWPPGTLYDKLYYDRPWREIEWKQGDSLPEQLVACLTTK